MKIQGCHFQHCIAPNSLFGWNTGKKKPQNRQFCDGVETSMGPGAGLGCTHWVCTREPWDGTGSPNPGM